MNTRTLLALILLSGSSFGQTTVSSEKKIYALFKKSIVQNDKKKIEILSNPWFICNTDSSFYINDTLRLLKATSHYETPTGCCDNIAWTFYRKDKFVLTRLKSCKEPPRASVPKSEDFFGVSFNKIENSLYLLLTARDGLFAKYKIIGIQTAPLNQPAQTLTTITLLRQ